MRHRHVPEQLAAPGGSVLGEVGARAQGEGIGDLHRAVGASQLGDQDGAVLLVPLPAVQQRLGRDGDGTAADAVDQAAEQRRAVEAGDAEPDHRAVPADQGRGGAIPDQAVVLDGR